MEVQRRSTTQRQLAAEQAGQIQLLHRHKKDWDSLYAHLILWLCVTCTCEASPPHAKLRTLWNMRYANGNTSDQVPYNPLSLVYPQPVENGKTSKEEVSPLQHSLGRRKVGAERFRNYWLFGNVKFPESVASPSTSAYTSIRYMPGIGVPSAFKRSKLQDLWTDCPVPANSHISPPLIYKAYKQHVAIKKDGGSGWQLVAIWYYRHVVFKGMCYDGL